MNDINSLALSMSNIVRTFVAILVVSLFPISNAEASCQLCAGYPCALFCQHVGVGVTNCRASNSDCDCVNSGIPCAWTITKSGGEKFTSSCATAEFDKKSKSQQITIVPEGLEYQQETYSGDGITSRVSTAVEPPWREEADSIAEPSPLEIEELEKLKERTKNDVDAGLMADDFIDYMTIIQNEPRDEAWAPQAEIRIAQELSSLPLEESGLSRPIVRCATRVCEIMIVQSVSGAENMPTNWQTQFIETIASETLGVAVADTTTLMTHVGDGKPGFVSYILIDRELSN